MTKAMKYGITIAMVVIALISAFIICNQFAGSNNEFHSNVAPVGWSTTCEINNMEYTDDVIDASSIMAVQEAETATEGESLSE